MRISLESRLLEMPLFCGVDAYKLKKMLLCDGVRRESFARGDTVAAGNINAGSLVIILSGCAEVKNGVVLLRELHRDGIFGVSTLFPSDEKTALATAVTAKTALSALIIPREAVRSLLAQDERAAMNYIAFLTDRIEFLNSVIDRYTGAGVIQNLAAYLCNTADEKGTELSLNISATAAVLNVGRASLYRALDELTERKIIVRSGRSIVVSDTDGLKKIADGGK